MCHFFRCHHRILRNVFGRNDVYVNVTEWDSFELCLSRTLPTAGSGPLSIRFPLNGTTLPKTYRKTSNLLLERRSRVRDLILSFKNSSRNPLPQWRERT